MRNSAFAACCVACAGLALMALEVSGPRLLAPAFGSGTIVWSGVIACVMLALSTGSLLGGRLSARSAFPSRVLAMLLLGGGLSTALAAAIAPPLAIAISSRFSLTAAAQSMALGIVGVLLFALPGVLLAAVFPLCLRAITPSVERTGPAYGLLYASSTLGSLAGVLLPPLVLMGAVGTRNGVMLLALPVVACGCALLVGRSGLLILAVGVAAFRSADGGGAWESSYAAYRLGEVQGTQVLQVNEGVCYSMYRPDLRVTGQYYDAFVAAPLLVGDTPPRHIALIGLAGGTLVHLYRAAWPRATLEAVEVDATLIDAAQHCFAVDIPVACADGRCWLRAGRADYDVIAVDAMCGPTPPLHLMSGEFFSEAARHLSADGLIVVNAPPGLDGPTAAAARVALPHVRMIRNVVIASRREIVSRDISTAFSWAGWPDRARAMRADLREPPTAPAIGDDVGTLPWWWGLHVDSP